MHAFIDVDDVASAVARLTAMAASKRPVCVVLTNYATKDMRRRCLDAGATRVFDKTDEIEELISFFSEQVP